MPDERSAIDSACQRVPSRTTVEWLMSPTAPGAAKNRGPARVEGQTHGDRRPQALVQGRAEGARERRQPRVALERFAPRARRVEAGGRPVRDLRRAGRGRTERIPRPAGPERGAARPERSAAQCPVATGYRD